MALINPFIVILGADFVQGQNWILMKTLIYLMFLSPAVFVTNTARSQ